MKTIPKPCMCGADDCPRCYPGRPRCVGCGKIDCEDEDCLDKREAYEEAKAEARQERQDEARMNHKLAIEWGGME